ncbi:MAG: cardiolipin synthase [Sedimenticolaceae bacterium]
MWTTVGLVGLVSLQLAVIARAILRPHRDPASRIAWVAVIAAIPILGIFAYLLFGETSIGRKRIDRNHAVLAELPPPAPPKVAEEGRDRAEIPAHYAPLFRLGETINGFPPVGGNAARLMADSNSGIDSMVADMDAATDHIHLIFYIWLADNNGLKVVEALERAAARGVACRAMADGLGSRAMIRSKHWKAMREAGVQVAVALPIGNPLLRPLHGRIDLRNHRKIVIIDDRITYCGSQNCADPEFRVKPKFAPWVDALMRFEGPVARQNQHVFASDWMTYVDEDIRGLLEAPIDATGDGFAAQVIATGPTVRSSAMPETFGALLYGARRELVITTPYYVPNETLQSALCAAAHRGVRTTIVFPARNDSWQVAGASRSYYRGLLAAGVEIYEYEGGLLHTKSITLDGEVTLIGSANMDRRSFDLNYENNILLYDATLTAAMRARQESYIALSRTVKMADVEAWPVARRLWNNAVGMLSPLL